MYSLVAYGCAGLVGAMVNWVVPSGLGWGLLGKGMLGFFVAMGAVNVPFLIPSVRRRMKRLVYEEVVVSMRRRGDRMGLIFGTGACLATLILILVPLESAFTRLRLVVFLGSIASVAIASIWCAGYLRRERLCSKCGYEWDPDLRVCPECASVWWLRGGTKRVMEKSRPILMVLVPILCLVPFSLASMTSWSPLRLASDRALVRIVEGDPRGLSYGVVRELERRTLPQPLADRAYEALSAAQVDRPDSYPRWNVIDQSMANVTPGLIEAHTRKTVQFRLVAACDSNGGLWVAVTGAVIIDNSSVAGPLWQLVSLASSEAEIAQPREFGWNSVFTLSTDQFPNQPLSLQSRFDQAEAPSRWYRVLPRAADKSMTIRATIQVTRGVQPARPPTPDLTPVPPPPGSLISYTDEVSVTIDPTAKLPIVQVDESGVPLKKE